MIIIFVAIVIGLGLKPGAKIWRFGKMELSAAIVLFLVANALPCMPARADDAAQLPGSVPPACAGKSTPVCKLEFIGTWRGDWNDVRFDKDGTYSISDFVSKKKRQTTWFVSDPETVMIIEPREGQPPRLMPVQLSISGDELTYWSGSLPPKKMRRATRSEGAAAPEVHRSAGAVEALKSNEFTLPVSDPLMLFALAQKLDPKAVIVTVRSCFSVNGCQSGRRHMFDITPRYDSAFTQIPSTRIIAGLRDCSRLEAVQNEFQMRDLDIETRAAVESAATSVPTRFSGLALVATVGKYDFNRQGFPLTWKPRIKIFTGRTHCHGQEITDYGFKFPRDFYLYVDETHLPKFLAVPADKARTIAESAKPFGVQAIASVEVKAFDKGMLDVKGTGITSGWIFSGPSSITQLAWISDGRIVEEITLPGEAKALPQPVATAPTLKVNSVRIVRLDVNVRTMPSKSAELATVLKPHAYVTVTEKSPDGLWSRVKVDDKVVGWMLDSALIKNSMTEEQAAAMSEGNAYDDVQPPQ